MLQRVSRSGILVAADRGAHRGRSLHDCRARPRHAAAAGSMCSITHSTTSGSAPRRPIWTRSRTGPTAPPGECTERAGLGPEDVDLFNPYDGYAPMTQFFLEAFQWHGVKAATPSRSTRTISGLRDRTRSTRAAAIWGTPVAGRLLALRYSPRFWWPRPSAGSCHRQESAIAGTVFHRTRTDLHRRRSAAQYRDRVGRDRHLNRRRS